MLNTTNVFLLALVIALAIGLVAMAFHLPPPITEEQYAAAQKTKDHVCQYSYLRCWWNWTTPDAVAFYTSVLFIATAILGVATLKLWRSTDKLWEEAKRQFAATQRPKIRLKHLWLTNDIWQGQAIVVTVTCVNVGTTEAVLQQVGIRYDIIEKARCSRPMPPSTQLFRPMGQRCRADSTRK